MVLLLIVSLTLFTASVKSYNFDIANPLIYKFPKTSDKSSYFGMSVITRPKASEIKDSWVFQIGAPRGNITGLQVKEPGAVYRCLLYGPCELFVLDDKGNEPGINYVHRYTDRKNEAWIGVSMDIKAFADNARTLVCGSRWSNQNLTNDDRIALTYLMTGVCYLQDVSIDSEENLVHKLLPLVNPDKIYFPKPYAFDKSFYYWGLGQAGLSAALFDDLTAAVIGAPGYNNWLGTVILYNMDVRILDFKVGLFEGTKEIKRNSYPYIGYQVSFGRFFSDGKLWLLASAPRAENYHGKVIIFQIQEPHGLIHIASEIMGISFGEYFGSSLAVSDINSDGFDDLVVGAPLFSRRHPEEGRIYVYLGTNRGHFLFRSQIINGRNGYSRFGSCVSALGDLDQDGFKDVAIGAPYEFDGTGAVYIYKGSKKGLEMEYSQLILARDVDKGLRGFGISIWGGTDVDGNKYNDMAVGAFLSDEMVVLRSRPIIDLHSDIYLENIFLLDRKTETFNVTICSKYSGSNAPQSAKFTRTIEVDANQNRAFVMGSDKSVNKKTIYLAYNEIKCEVLTVFLKEGNVNYKPIHITLKSELPSCHSDKVSALFIWDKVSEEKDLFSKWCPVGRKKETSIEVPFAGECGPDNECQAELELTCQIPESRNNTFITISSELTTVYMDLRNNGEPAHNTEIIILSNMDLISSEYLDGNKVEVSKRIFSIDVGTIFDKNFRASFSFTISTDILNSNETGEWPKNHLEIQIKARTKSSEQFLGDNNCDINFRLLSNSALELYSTSSLTNSFEAKKTPHLNFTVYFEVLKKGETPISEAELNIYIPTYLVGFKELEFATVKVETSDWMYSSIRDEDHNEYIGPSEVDINWFNVNSSNISLPAARTVFLNCSSNVIRCRIITIIFQDEIPTLVSSQVKLFISLNLNVIDSLTVEKDIIHFVSAGILEFRKLFEAEPSQIYAHSSISFYKEKEYQKVEPYVIALSVVAGSLFLFLIVTALFKYEFFRRKKKEELIALKSEELRRQSNYEFPPEIIGGSDGECNPVKEMLYDGAS